MVFFFCCPPFFFFFCRLCLEFPSFYSLEWLVQFVPTLTMKSFISVKTVVTRGAQSPMMSLQRKDFGAVLIKVKLKPVSTWSALELEVSEFLLYLQPPKNISSALPIDIVKFLVWKDVNGRTVVHKPHCKFLGVKGKTQCDCPTRLARGTVDSVIGKLRSIFSSHDRVQLSVSVILPQVRTLRIIFQVIFQKQVRVFHRGFQTLENIIGQDRAYGLVLLLFSSVWKPR